MEAAIDDRGSHSFSFSQSFFQPFPVFFVGYGLVHDRNKKRFFTIDQSKMQSSVGMGRCSWILDAYIEIWEMKRGMNP